MSDPTTAGVTVAAEPLRALVRAVGQVEILFTLEDGLLKEPLTGEGRP